MIAGVLSPVFTRVTGSFVYGVFEQPARNVYVLSEAHEKHRHTRVLTKHKPFFLCNGSVFEKGRQCECSVGVVFAGEGFAESDSRGGVEAETGLHTFFRRADNIVEKDFSHTPIISRLPHFFKDLLH